MYVIDLHNGLESKVEGPSQEKLTPVLDRPTPVLSNAGTKQGWERNLYIFEDNIYNHTNEEVSLKALHWYGYSNGYL